MTRPEIRAAVRRRMRLAVVALCLVSLLAGCAGVSKETSTLTETLTVTHTVTLNSNGVPVGETGSAPRISFHLDDQARSLTVVNADQAEWRDVAISFAKSPDPSHCRFQLNDGPVTPAATESPVGSGTRAVMANDQITISQVARAEERCIFVVNYPSAHESYGTYTVWFFA